MIASADDQPPVLVVHRRPDPGAPPAADLPVPRTPPASSAPNRSRYAAAFERGPAAQALVEARTGLPAVVLQASAALAGLLGRPLAELAGLELVDLFGAEARPGQDSPLLRPDGSTVWIRISATMVRNAAGHADHVVLLVTDVTARCRAEAAAERSGAGRERLVRGLRRTLTPPPAERVGPFRVASRHRPESAEYPVGGSWADVFGLPDGRVGFVIGTVPGPGLDAAVPTAGLRSLVRMLAVSGMHPAGVLRRINDLVGEPDGSTSTLVHGQFDPATGVCVSSNAGHLPLYVLLPADGDAPGGACPVPAVGGPALGAVPGAGYEQDAAALAPGSSLVGLTVGLLDPRCGTREEGLFDLLAHLDRLPGAVAREPEAVAAGLLARTSGAGAGDTRVLVLGLDRDHAPAPDASAHGAAARDAAAALPRSEHEVALLDGTGTIVAVNAAWERFALGNGGDPARTGVGMSYLRICEQAGDPASREVARALRSAIEGRLPSVQRLRISCDAPGLPRTFQLLISSRRGPDGRVTGATVVLVREPAHAV